MSIMTRVVVAGRAVYFSAPEAKGYCSTKNANVENIYHIKSEYETFFFLLQQSDALHLNRACNTID